MSRKEKDLIIHLLVVGFHHKKGHQIELSVPLLCEPLDVRWSSLLSLSLPDGAHHREEDFIYFHLPSLEEENGTVFGLSSYRQMSTDTLEKKEADVTRNSIQKSVCLLLRRPVSGSLREELRWLSERYFLCGDFTRRDLFDEFVARVNVCPPSFDPLVYSVRCVHLRYRHRMLILFKLLLLQKKVLVMLTPIQTLDETLLALLSVIPELLSSGLNECTEIGEENEQAVRDLSDQSHLKEQSNKEEEEEETFVEKSSPVEYLRRARSIPSELAESFERLTSVPCLSSSSCELVDLHGLHFPLPLFGKNCLFHPYLSIHSLSELRRVEIRSYLVGASNELFRQDEDQRHDLIVNDEEEPFLFLSPTLKAQLQLTTPDRRFTQLFEDPLTNETKSEEELRRLLTIYLLSLLSVAANPNDQALSDFNSSYLRCFQETRAFQTWIAQQSQLNLKSIPPRHPLSGQLNVTDVKLRVAHVLEESCTGRRVKETLEETSLYLGERSRVAGKVIGEAKNSLFSSLRGTFDQTKLWFNKSNAPPSPSSDSTEQQ